MKRFFVILSLLALAVLMSGCVAGSARFTPGEPAGFFTGLWHGIISVVMLIIHIFDRTILVYETNNTGGWYDFGFLLGVICIWGGGSAARRRKKMQKEKCSEWEEIAPGVEEKIRNKMRSWAEAEPDENWDEVEKKLEKKLKDKVRTWFDESKED